MARKFSELKEGGVGEVGNVFETGEIGSGGTAADIDEDLIGSKGLACDLHFVRGEKFCLAVDDGAAFGVGEHLAKAVAGVLHDLVGAGLDLGEGNGDVTVYVDAEFCGFAGAMGYLRAGDQGLGGCAARVDAGAAEDVALDERDGLTGGGEADSEEWACLAGADDEGVVVGGHGC
jgi:hypothetical protein